MAIEISGLAAEATLRPNDTKTPSVSSDVGNVVAIRGQRQDAAAVNQSLPAGNRPSAQETAQKLDGLRDALSKVNESPKIARRSLEFSLNEDLGRAVITIKDLETDEVIRQIPPEEIVEFSKYLREAAEESRAMPGLVVRTEA